MTDNINYIFKPYKSLDEMINYLEQNKKVIFKKMNKEEAKNILYIHNYINVITPFKHHFAKTFKGVVIKDECGNHIYEHETDFSEYYELYVNERKQYPTLYKNITKFETIFNSIVSYEVIRYYEIFDYNSFHNAMDKMKKIGSNSTDKDSIFLVKTITKINERISSYDSVYLLFDRLSLNETLTIFKLSDDVLKRKIFNSMREKNTVFNLSDIEQFQKTISKIIPIRNVICHCNSLEILLRYYRPNKTALRTRSDYRSHKNIINKLLNM